MKRLNLFIQIIGWLIILLVIVSPALLSARSLRGSGKQITMEKEFTDFDKIQISHSFEATIDYGKEYSVIVSIDDNLKEYLHIEKKGRTLKVGMEKNRSYKNAHLKVVITLPDIKALGLSGASDAKLKGFEFEHDFTLNLSGASEVRGVLKTGDLDLGLSGASDVTLKGNGDNLFINASGASTVIMDDFSVYNADLNLSGASDCVLNIEGELDVQASGASKVKFRGKGKIDSIDMSGASRVSRI